MGDPWLRHEPPPSSVRTHGPRLAYRRAQPGSGRDGHSGTVPRSSLRLVPAAHAVIFDKVGNVLLTRRADNGLWCCPSGQMEPGESLVETVVRETLEETGLEVVVDRAVGVYSSPHPYYTEKGRHIIGFGFVCRVVGGTLRLSEETTEFGYFPPDDLPEDIVPTHVERVRDAVAALGGADFQVR